LYLRMDTLVQENSRASSEICESAGRTDFEPPEAVDEKKKI
jgi:hypothetical protein